MKLYLKKLEEDVTIPQFKTEGSAGMDVQSREDFILKPGHFKIVKTGLSCAVEPGYELQVRPRSGLACNHGITVINTPGTIDSDYRGEICVGLINLSLEDFEIKKGDRIAQLVVNKVEQPQIEVVTELSSTDRNDGGFGSTGI